MRFSFAILGLTLVLASAAHAQQTQRDDVQWETRREPYDGRPMRPGWQLDGAESSLTWTGSATFLGALAATIIYGLTVQPIAAIPIVGPWVVVGGYGGGKMPPNDTER